MNVRAVVILASLVVGLLFVVSVFNPHAQIPVLSKTACAIKGGAWYDGDSWGNPPGCYSPSSFDPPDGQP